MSRVQFVYQKPHMNWPGVDPMTPQEQAGEWTRVVREWDGTHTCIPIHVEKKSSQRQFLDIRSHVYWFQMDLRASG